MDPSKLKQFDAYQKGDELGGYKIHTIVGRNNDLGFPYDVVRLSPYGLLGRAL